jgi:hypothetical protein
MNLDAPPEVAPFDETRLNARQAHLEREVARSGARTPHRRRGLRAGVVGAVGFAAVAALLSGRGGGPDVVSRALAAVSRGPYLGVVARSPHAGSLTLVHLETHSVERVRPQVEIWFDTRKHGARANAGGCIRLVGPVTRSGCYASVFSGGDPIAITGSLDRYRTALASGHVRKVNEATVRGHKATWLRVTPSRSAFPKGSAVYVAVDQRSGRPLRIETRLGKRIFGRQDIDIVAQARTLPASVLPPVTFPPRVPLPGKGHGRGGRDITLAQAARILPGALWAGRTVAGEPFRRARAIALDNGKTQIELRYGRACPAHCILIKQGVVAGWSPGGHFYRGLPDQSVLIPGGRLGNGRAGAILLRLEGTDKAAMIATARALRPL